MRHLQVKEVGDLYECAAKAYELGLQTPSGELDSAVSRLIRCWDSLCNLLEKHGRHAAESRETVSVEDLHDALGMTEAAAGAIDSASPASRRR